MAEELRWEGMLGAGGTVSADSQAEFRNDSSRFIHIRQLRYSIRMSAAGVDEMAVCEVSKSPAYTRGGVSPFFSFPVTLASATAVALDSSMSINGGQSYAKGQLTLEPGESLFLNMAVFGAPTVSNSWEIGYHF